jgi:polar amino acid transport system substrate-binding protein
MKRLLWLLISGVLLTSLILSSACSGASSEKTVTVVFPANPNVSSLTPMKAIVASDCTWPPFETINDKTKAIEGFDIDVIKAVGVWENINLDIQNIAWDALLAGVAQGTYDMAISSITITADRQKDMAFSDPYWSAGQMVVVKKNNNTITGIQTITGDIGVQLGTTGDFEVQKIKGATSKPYDQIGLAFQDLMNGQINAVVCDNPVAMLYVNNNPSKLKSVGGIFTSEGYGVAFPKTKADLQARVNDGLKALKSNGTLDKIAEKWKVK